jgi:IclR family transcriptional regulator, pca regulon regulatory protein
VSTASVRRRRKQVRARARTAPRARRLAPPTPAPDKEFMTTLAKGLTVLGAFGRQRPAMTLSEAAQVAELSRATARRVLRTLTSLGFVEQIGRQFTLAPRILDLGFAYLSAQNWVDRALPLLRELNETLHEATSASILQGTEIVYVARVPARRIMSTAISVGSRLSAFHTSMGRAQLGFLDDAEVWRRLKSVRIEPYTPSTITDLQALFDRIRADREQGFAIVDEELERGLRSIAVPVVDRDGQAVGAINIATHTTRTTRNEMRAQFLPALRAAAAQISKTVA